MRRVAAVAQEGRTSLQQALGSGAVRVVASGAVFGNRLVVVHEGAALFHVAGVAGLGDAVALHEAGACGAVHVVAVRASHLAFGHRVVRGLVGQRALFFVAGVADFGLRGFVTHLVFCHVHLVAGGAGYVTCLVGAAFPMRALGVLGVAVLAGTVAGI